MVEGQTTTESGNFGSAGIRKFRSAGIGRNRTIRLTQWISKKIRDGWTNGPWKLGEILNLGKWE